MAALVVASRHGAEILEPIDGTLDDVATLIFFGIERRRAPTTAATSEAVLFRILSLRANASNTAALNRLARGTGALRFIDPPA